MFSLDVEKQRGRHAALAIAAIVVVVGIPLWWRTTETYRAWLPISQIQQLESLHLCLTVEVEVVFAQGTLTADQQKKLPLSQIGEQRHSADAETQLKYRYETKYRTATIMEEDALNQRNAAGADKSLHILSENACGSVVVYVLPESSTLLPESVRVYVGLRRTALLKFALRGGVALKGVLSAIDPEVEQVVQTMSFTHQDILAALSNRIRSTKVSKESLVDSMRAFKSSPGYEITFSLLNPSPQFHNLRWDIETAVQQHIQPLLNKLSVVANFSVDSQILYYAVLGVNPRFDKKASAYTLSADSLAHVINPVEARLGSNAASSNPTLNFLLYVPDPQHSPLYIRDHRKQKVSSNAFHSPRWGGIMIYNVNDLYDKDVDFPVNLSIDMNKVMGVFLAQLRLLLGVQQVHPPKGFQTQGPGSTGVADWEMDRLLWSRSVENVATASATIISLSQLLDKIGNIVINDNIADKVLSAVTSLQAAIAELEAGNLAFAFQYSREAILASECAFFDPSLLHLLYFPDDQKFAIYIPLFLPMCVPIVISLAKIVNEMRQRRAEKNAKKD